MSRQLNFLDFNAMLIKLLLDNKEEILVPIKLLGPEYGHDSRGRVLSEINRFYGIVDNVVNKLTSDNGDTPIDAYDIAFTIGDSEEFSSDDGRPQTIVAILRNLSENSSGSYMAFVEEFTRGHIKVVARCGGPDDLMTHGYDVYQVNDELYKDAYVYESFYGRTYDGYITTTERKTKVVEYYD